MHTQLVLTHPEKKRLYAGPVRSYTQGHCHQSTCGQMHTDTQETRRIPGDVCSYLLPHAGGALGPTEIVPFFAAGEVRVSGSARWAGRPTESESPLLSQGSSPFSPPPPSVPAELPGGVVPARRAEAWGWRGVGAARARELAPWLRRRPAGVRELPVTTPGGGGLGA